MARTKSRRSLRFDNLEGRQLLSSGGPTDQEQYMLQLINEARTDPAAAAEMLTTNLTPEVQETLQYFGVNAQTAAQTIASATRAAAAGVERRPGERSPGSEPVHGQQPDPVALRRGRVDAPAAHAKPPVIATSPRAPKTPMPTPLRPKRPCRRS